MRLISCADFTFPLLEHDRVLALIALLELKGVDLGLFGGRSHLDLDEELSDPARNGVALKAKLDRHGLVPADVFLQVEEDFAACAVNHPDENRRDMAWDRFIRTIEYAHAASCPHVTILPGVVYDSLGEDTSWKLACDELAKRVDFGKQTGITVSVEAHVGSLAPTPAKAMQLIHNTPGLTLTLDYGHFIREGVSDHVIEPLIRHASHFHARGGRSGRLQSSLKENTIDFAQVCRAMHQSGYTGAICLEYVWIDWEHCNEVDNLSETILLRNLIRQSLSNPGK